VVVFEHAYHGRTNLTMAMTAKSMPYKHRFGPFAPEIYRAPMSYPLRDGGLSGPDAARRAIDVVEKQVGAANVAAVLVEPIQGEGGFVVPAPGFLSALSRWAADVGAIFVADEIQTGFCRTGSWFACTDEDVVPDLATIETMRELDLCAAAREIEAVALPRLREMAAANPSVGEVRGRGAMLALEFVVPGEQGPAGPLPDPATTSAIAAACHAAGLLVLTCGTYGNVIRLLPPLVIDEDTLVLGLEILGEAVAPR